MIFWLVLLHFLFNSYFFIWLYFRDLLILYFFCYHLIVGIFCLSVILLRIDSAFDIDWRSIILAIWFGFSSFWQFKNFLRFILFFLFRLLLLNRSEFIWYSMLNRLFLLWFFLIFQWNLCLFLLSFDVVLRNFKHFSVKRIPL